MDSITSAPPRVKASSKPVSRAYRFLYRHPGEALKAAVRLVLTFKNRSEIYRYWLQRIDADFGIGFELEKIEPDGATGPVYHVNVEGEQDGRCDCLGAERWGRCKHLDLCHALIAREKLN